MPKHFSANLTKTTAFITGLPGKTWCWLVRFWRRGIWRKLTVILCAFLIVALGTMYGIGRWYMWTQRNTPQVMGTTFVADYAQSLGLDPQATYSAILNDLHVKQLRLVSYWNDIEPTPGQYNFAELDSEFHQAEAAHAKITLSIGLRQPRWPECHMPGWASTEPASQWQPQLAQFMQAVVNRYKNSPALQSYQLENEYFLQQFGTCTDFSRTRLVNEFNLVKKADPKHPIIMSRSNNFPGWATGNPQPDIVGMSVYRRVWDGTVTHRYFAYPLPTWYYAFLAGTQKILTGKPSIIHELQAEAWPPDGQSITQTSLAEQNKTMDATQLRNTIQFGRATHMPQVYLWGSEYWYYRMTVLHDPSLWNVAKQAFTQPAKS